jgi:hypothetical protein
MSKGSDRRPRQITESQEEDNWSRIFGKSVISSDKYQQEQAAKNKLAKEYLNHLLHDSEDDKFPDELTKQD